MRRLAIFVGTGLLVGCQSTRPEPPRSLEDTALRVRVAHAEARRGDAVAELVELARSTDVHARELALRGLGRTGGAQAIDVLERALADHEPRVTAAALGAIGIAASLDDLDADTMARLSPMLVAALSRAPLPALEALGRAGDASVQGELAARLADPDPAIASAAALALARHGRRKLAWTADARAALAKATAHADGDVRYAATYALSREHEPSTEDGPVNLALATRILDNTPETRAAAIAALARRKAVTAGRRFIIGALRDRDWRVAVEAVRALAGPSGDDAGRAIVAAMLPARLAALGTDTAPDAQVIVEALRAFIEHPPVDRAPLVELARAATANAALPAITRGWIVCLAEPERDKLLECPLPDHLRLPLYAAVAKQGDANARRAALRVLLAHDDPRVRAAGLSLLPAMWDGGDATAHATLVGTVANALVTKDALVAGTAIDVAGELYDQLGTDPLREMLDAAVLARARTETDVELASSLYALIGKHAIAGGADACRPGLTGHPARANAAAECLRTLGEAAPAVASRPAPEPPAQPETVIGAHWLWHLATTRGEIVIELLPETAPWAVASIVALTKRGFYDGLEVHRVVPDFVVQGGDPTMSGWGGPGYTLPAEPASGADGPGYVAGGVGIADAGRDSGGSQWFIMHSRAPHLDGRYTWIGRVVSGQRSADALLIGDKVERATIERK